MKYLIFFTLLFINLKKTFGQKENCMSRTDMIKQAIISFRDTLKNKHEDEFSVLVVHFYIDSKTQNEAITVSSIYNSSDFKNLNAHYYFWVNDIPVLVKDAD